MYASSQLDRRLMVVQTTFSAKIMFLHILRELVIGNLHESDTDRNKKKLQVF